VIAQQVAPLTDGEWEWSVETITVPGGDEHLEITAAEAARFLVGNGDPVLVGPAAEEPEVRLAAGEGYALRPQREAVAIVADGEASELIVVTLGAGSGDGAFPAPDAAPGTFDIDVLRDVLVADESAEFGGGGVPAVVYVTDGAAEVASFGRTDRLEAGQMVIVDSDFAITAVDGPAAVLVGIVSAVIAGDAEVTRSAAPSVASLPSEMPSALSTAPSESPSESPSPSVSPSASASPSPSPSELVDTDGDGLTDEDELRAWGTDPAKYDTDGDGASDGMEVDATTDPLNPDMDLDGLPDGVELRDYGTDVRKPDTDGDGWNDVQDITFGTDPTNPDTDGDGLNDYDEIHVSRTNPLNPDTDGDGNADSSELLVGTNPLEADSDGDGRPDPQDAYPLDPNQ
jgi:hypothetical protein